jgi:hypothetical protein
MSVFPQFAPPPLYASVRLLDSALAKRQRSLSPCYLIFFNHYGEGGGWREICETSWAVC